MGDNYHTLKDEFLNPSNEFTPIPFWFWNDEITADGISMQLEDFREKGVMGFVIHPRIGLPESIAFLSDTFLNLIETAIEEATKHNMTVFLYDEAMYPSGSAHGMVVEGNPEYASRGIKVLEFIVDLNTDLQTIKKQILDDETNIGIVSMQLVRKPGKDEIESDSPVIVKTNEDIYKCLLDGNNTGGYDGWTLLVFVEGFTGGVIRGIHFGEDDNEPGAPLYPDILNPEVIKKYIRIVYDTFYKRFKRYFGNTVKAIFTDEPKPMGRGSPAYFRPWTAGFIDYLREHGFTEEQLPFLWYRDQKGLAAEAKRKFEKIINKRMGEVFYQPISSWCESHGIALAGHPMKADDIGLQEYFHIPGQDVVLRFVEPGNRNSLEGSESTQAKCTSDAARHRGRRRNSNECFGGFGWQLRMDEMKWVLDWLFVRGVNLIIPHAFYYSVRGERYWERPPDVGPNNPWWPHFKTVSDYIKRMCWLMTDSFNLARVAVLCENDRLSWRIAKPLYQNQIEFNYLEEEILVSNECTVEGNCICINRQRYDIVLIEDIQPISEKTRKKLSRFQENGGRVVYLKTTEGANGNLPAEGIHVSSEEELVEAADGFSGRTVELYPHHPDIRVSHIVKEGIEFYLLVNEGEQVYEGMICLSGEGETEIWNAWDGCIKSVDSNKPLIIAQRESIIVAVK